MTTVIEKLSNIERIKNALISRVDFRPVACNSLQMTALSDLAKNEFPTIKNEEWKYSNVKPILELDFNHLSSDETVTDEALRHLIISKENNLLVFINGHFSPSNSLILDQHPGLILGNLAAQDRFENGLVAQHFGKYATTEQEIFTALNTSYVSDGAFIFVPSGCHLTRPVQLLFVTTALGISVVQPRVLIVAEKGAVLSVIESYQNLDASNTFTNAVTEIVCGENAQVSHAKIQLENNASFHIGTTNIHQQRTSVFNSHVFTFDGGFVRNNLTVALDAEGVTTHLFGLYLPKQEQHVDNHTLVDHKKPHCNSNEIYKGIIDEQASGVFNGKIFVREDAQKTNAFQSNKNILLSDFARMNSKPQLEIFADDVKCSHGSTTGQFDEDALFYMRARGIGEEQAKNLLMHAFASEIIESVQDNSLKTYLYELLSSRLEHDFR
jgi:Fe-S cluster assembly protein SufD